VDPVIDQLSTALETLDHDVVRVATDKDVVPVVSALRKIEPELVFNIAESFAGRSALESNVAALLNLLDLRYTGSSPAGLLLAGDKTLTKQLLRFHRIRTPEFPTIHRSAVDWADDTEFLGNV